jgi:hypothetical protein
LIVSCDLARDIGNHANCCDDGSIGFCGFFFVAAGPKKEKGYDEEEQILHAGKVTRDFDQSK